MLSGQRAESSHPARSPPTTDRLSGPCVCLDIWEPREERQTPVGLLLCHQVQTPLQRTGGEVTAEGREREAENMMEIPSGTRPLGVAKPDHSPRPVGSCRGLHRRASAPRAVLCLSTDVSPAAVPIEGHTASGRARHLLGLSSQVFPECTLPPSLPPSLGLFTREEWNRHYIQMVFPK